MIQGSLIYDKQMERYKIRFGPDKYSDGLHCGTGFDVLVNGKWKHTRIEMKNYREGDIIKNSWYLVGVKCEDLTALTIKLREDEE